MAYTPRSDEFAGHGWENLIKGLIELCELHKVEIFQIKEKFGELRFYVGEAPEHVHAVINACCAESRNICEECGKHGRIRRTLSWWTTLCDDHFEKALDGKGIKIYDFKYSNSIGIKVIATCKDCGKQTTFTGKDGKDVNIYAAVRRWKLNWVTEEARCPTCVSTPSKTPEV